MPAPRLRWLGAVRRVGPVVVALLVLFGWLSSGPEAGASQAAPKNKCSDPYWRYTLRCQMFPSKKPQPNLGSSPRRPRDIKDFTRVFLTADLTVRSLDGTIPLIYVDKAICTDPAGCGPVAYGDPIESNKWIISMTGGGSCHPHDSDGDGIFDDAQQCVDIYADPLEQGEMSTATQPSMRNLTGINLPDPALNPVFAGYNRVRVQKSSYDRYDGRVAYLAPGGYFHETGPLGQPLDFNFFQQGYLLVEQALSTLGPGLTYTTWIPDGQGGVQATTERACRR